MSVNTVADDDDVAQLITNEPTQNARYSFKTTDENKTNAMNVSLTHESFERIESLVVDNDCWRSNTHFFNDAMVFYLDNESSSGDLVEEITEEVEWGSEKKTCFNVTQTVYDEIHQMVSHSHTPWNTKQEFYICALYEYDSAGFPPVTQR